MSAPTMPLKIMLIEDETAFREALAFVLFGEHELEAHHGVLECYRPRSVERLLHRTSESCPSTHYGE